MNLSAFACLAVRWLAAGVLLFVAAHLKSPYLFKFRALETPLLLALCLGLAWISARRLVRVGRIRRVFLRRHPPHGKADDATLIRPTQAIELERSEAKCRSLSLSKGTARLEILLLALLGLIAGLTLVNETRFYLRQQALETADPVLRQALGQHFVVGYTDFEAIRDLAAQGAIGGVFITRRNLNASPDLAGEIRALQAVRVQAGLPPLWVATDQEGGLVSRLSPPLTALPPLAEAAALPSAEAQISAARAYGETHGQELAALGVNLNFAPVVDLKIEHANPLLDFDTFISKRAISADPTVVARIALAYAEGLETHAVRATLKHFPGLARVTEDTHHFSASLEVAPAELAVSDWLPFRQILARSNALMMLGHVSLSALDPGAPASVSEKVVAGVIRHEWGHQGVLITDDLSMGAIYWRAGSVCGATVQALNAGVDLLLIAYDWRQYYAGMACALDAAQTQTLDAARLAESARRLAQATLGQAE